MVAKGTRLPPRAPRKQRAAGGSCPRWPRGSGAPEEERLIIYMQKYYYIYAKIYLAAIFKNSIVI